MEKFLNYFLMVCTVNEFMKEWCLLWIAACCTYQNYAE